MNRPHCGLFLSGRLAKGEHDAIGVNKSNVRRPKIHDPVSMVKATESTVLQITGGSGGGRGSGLVSEQASNVLLAESVCGRVDGALRGSERSTE